MCSCTCSFPLLNAAPSMTISYTTTDTSVPTMTPTSTPSWLDEHLSLVIGVPTGIGLCILMFLGCLIYCGEHVCVWEEVYYTKIGNF